MMKILYPYANVMGIFFPVGKIDDGGTCQFATAKCLKECCAISHKKIGPSLVFRKKAFSFFVENNFITIAGKILEELKEDKCNVLAWFASGDCPITYKDKFVNIIKVLQDNGVVQTGITRSWNLWMDLLKIQNDQTRFLLTEESMDQVNVRNQSGGMYSIPDYKNGVIDIVISESHEVKKQYGCGGGYYTDHVLKGKIIKDDKYLDLNCQKCYDKKIGCFTKLLKN